MTDLDVLLRKLGVAIRRDAEPVDEWNLEGRFDDVMRRATRRRLLKIAGGPVVAVAVVAAVFTFLPALPLSGPTPALEAAASPERVPNDPSPEGVGFWPSVTEEESERLCDRLTNMRWQAPVAAGFVGEALGWSNTAERDVRRVDGDLIIKRQGNFPSTFVGGGTPDSPWITLELSRLGDAQCWWVTGVTDPDDDAEFSVKLRDGSLNAAWDMPPGATRGDLLVVDSNGRQLVSGHEGARSASVDGFEGPGYALVLWKGVDGTVVSASGATLPDGDHSSTTP